MYARESSSWLLLIAPFGFLLYVIVCLGILWLAVRVVRHAWYWQPSSARRTAARDSSESQP